MVQFLSAASTHWKETILRELDRVTGLTSIYERSDADVMALEGLEEKSGWISRDDESVIASDVDMKKQEGSPLVHITSAVDGLGDSGGKDGRAWSEEIEIECGGARYHVDIRAGQKTGFYLDQAGNRKRVGELADGKDVLNLFCYTGGFTMQWYVERMGTISLLLLLLLLYLCICNNYNNT